MKSRLCTRISTKCANRSRACARTSTKSSHKCTTWCTIKVSKRIGSFLEQTVLTVFILVRDIAIAQKAAMAALDRHDGAENAVEDRQTFDEDEETFDEDEIDSTLLKPGQILLENTDEEDDEDDQDARPSILEQVLSGLRVENSDEAEDLISKLEQETKEPIDDGDEW